jgi:hypothetical protein
MPLTTEDLQNRLSDITNVFIMFSVFFVILLLVFIFKARNNNLTFFKNRKKLNINKENNQDSILLVFVEFGFLRSIFMIVCFVFVLFSISTYTETKEKLKKAESGEITWGWKNVSLTEIKDKITIENNKLIIDKLPSNFDYNNSYIKKDKKQIFEIEKGSKNDKFVKLVYIYRDEDDNDIEYKITKNEFKEIKENR